VPDKSNYYYWVKAVNSSGTSEFSIKYDTGHLMRIPPPPAWVNATDGRHMNRIRVNWKSVPSANSYNVYRANFSLFNLSSWLTRKKIATISKSNYDDINIPCSTCCSEIYYYWVEAVNSAGVSKLSNRDSGYAYRTLKDPEIVYATDGLLDYCVRVEWSKVNGAKKYNIYRATSLEGEKVQIVSVSSNVDMFEDSSVTCSRKYYYWVKAIDNKGLTSCKYSDHDSGYCSGH